MKAASRCGAPWQSRWWPRLRICIAGLSAVCAMSSDAISAPGSAMRLLDGFDDITPWRVSASDDVEATLRKASGSNGSALCVDFDFGAVSGYAAVSRELPLQYGDNYEFSFGLRGEAPPNTLQFKLIDSSGENVWWVNRPDYAFPRQWERVRFKKRHIAFAWGPAKDRDLKRSTKLEFVVARGQGGGKGTVCVDRLSFRELPAATSTPPAVLSASSTLPPTLVSHAFDGAMETAWRSDPAAGADQTLTLDFQQPREFGGLILRWLPDAFASRYSVEFSDDGEHWRTVRNVVAGNGGADALMLPESETRYVRLRLRDGPAKAYALAEIEVKDLAFGASPNAFFEAIARAAPRGRYPRGFVGEQSYWTVVGIDGGSRQGLLSEDGALEIGPRSGSIEPFLLTDEGLLTWADAVEEQTLLDGYLPIPTVTWRYRGLAMHVTAYGTGDQAGSQLTSTYTLENLTDRPRTLTLALAIRPFQVNPLTQFLNAPGGVAPIRELSWDGRALSIDGEPRLFPLEKPDRVIVASFDAGDIPALLDQPVAVGDVKDEAGFASAVLRYRLELPPRGRRVVGVVVPLAGPPVLPADDATAWLKRQQTQIADEWRAKVNRVSLQLPTAGRPLANTLRTALAHILINRAGPALRPGSRAYARSWIRDGAMISDALLRLGHASVVREYIDWFAPHQFASGKVPCCVDSRGSDPVPESDSHGEFIYLIAEQYRYVRDRAWLRAMWPFVSSAIGYMDSLRLLQRTAQNQTPERRAFYGLMPASISHEGYSDRPAYSYWDDFWTLAGYDGAVEIAAALGRTEDAGRLVAQRVEFRHDLQASLRASVSWHGIDYLPGSADRGDFDPTSTTIALSVAGEQANLPQRQLCHTFERYWREFLRRRSGSTDREDYTPYELRNVGAFVRLGRRERAQQLLDFFLADRRPAGWNQWAEVVGRDVRQARFVGDMPHGWIASDFIQSVLDLFAYERAADQSLVLAAGVSTEWLDGRGIGVERLRTAYGELSYALRREGRRVVLTIAGGLTPPRGGLVFAWPYAGDAGVAVVNGDPSPWNKAKELRIHALPAVVTVEPGSAD
jgi:F5/8 type C domain-containing protein